MPTVFLAQTFPHSRLMQTECGVGAVCIRQGCRRVCEVSVIVKGCASQCNSSNECPFNQVCIRRECGNVCARNTVGIKY
jgi:hypothetical protein